MDTITTSKGDIKVTDKVYYDKNIKAQLTDVLFGYYVKPHGKKPILVNYKEPGELFSSKKKYTFKSNSEKETVQKYKDIVKDYPELDSVELKMWFVNLEVSQCDNYSLAGSMEKMFTLLNLQKIPYVCIEPIFISRNLNKYFDFTGITEDALLKFFEKLLKEGCLPEYYFGSNYHELIEKTILNKMTEFVEILIKYNQNLLVERYLKKFTPKFAIKFLTEFYEKKEFSPNHFYVYKYSLTEGQRDEFLPAMKNQSIAWNDKITYDDFLELFEGKIEISKFPLRKWIQGSKNKIELFKKFYPVMDLYTIKDITKYILDGCYSKEDLMKTLKILIE
jgi:hypothetical protein